MALHDKQDQRGVKIGVSFRHLSVYGYNSSTRYQPTVASYIVTLFESLTGLLSSRTRHGPQILHNFDGVVNGGEMLLVLGRPGSGCSTLLKTLAGEVRGLRIEKSVSVDYDGKGIFEDMKKVHSTDALIPGISYKQMHKSFKGDCIYLAELDIHFPELTLGQSLSFAAATRELDPGRALKAYNQAHDVSAQFGLNAAFNTKMGNAMIRGLSGGEKRRASIAEVYISEAQVQCWDNSTRGLDSTTALRFVQSIRRACDTKRTTVLMSIYQASDSIYEACILSSFTVTQTGLTRTLRASIRSLCSTKVTRSTLAPVLKQRATSSRWASGNTREQQPLIS
jgi:ATP-binding cassette subfamily G (WHITE) protein 2 (PDR)